MNSPPAMTVAPRTDGPVPETGTFGVGASATGHEQPACSVHDGFRQAPSTQARPDAQSLFIVHPWLHEDTGVSGVGVGSTTVEH